MTSHSPPARFLLTSFNQRAPPPSYGEGGVLLPNVFAPHSIWVAARPIKPHHSLNKNVQNTGTTSSMHCFYDPLNEPSRSKRRLITNKLLLMHECICHPVAATTVPSVVPRSQYHPDQFSITRLTQLSQTTICASRPWPSGVHMTPLREAPSLPPQALPVAVVLMNGIAINHSQHTPDHTTTTTIGPGNPVPPPANNP